MNAVDCSVKSLLHKAVLMATIFLGLNLFPAMVTAQTTFPMVCRGNTDRNLISGSTAVLRTPQWLTSPRAWREPIPLHRRRAPLFEPNTFYTFNAFNDGKGDFVIKSIRCAGICP
jgi:hypothetical protein